MSEYIIIVLSAYIIIFIISVYILINKIANKKDNPSESDKDTSSHF
jgi:cytochrome bd-type quinol oxidase subunit 1